MGNNQRRHTTHCSKDERIPLLGRPPTVQHTHRKDTTETDHAFLWMKSPTGMLVACLFIVLSSVTFFTRIQLQSSKDAYRILGLLSMPWTIPMDLPKPLLSGSNDGPCSDNPAPARLHQEDYSQSLFTKFKGKPLNVTYDSRSVMVNGERILLLGGSMHPSRATKQTWEMALNETVHQGLNLVTIYLIWAVHQPLRDSPIDWTLQHGIVFPCNDDDGLSDDSTLCDWDLAQSIQAAADRGLFVHVRVGPYVCAEYNYGGIPEWVATPGMSLRRPNRLWMTAMEAFVKATTSYLMEHQLFAYQGGPIILAQIENELGGDVDASTENLLHVDRYGNYVDHDSEFKAAANSSLRTATLQDYADWCGKLAENLVPDVVWTMCYGLSANNTIETYNGFFYDTTWMDIHGGSGRIQIDHPAIWTEDEGGFQIWGEEPDHPTDYIWGTTARSMANHALRWFARGGTHLNFYMWWGGYNRGRSAAAGIMNVYASDAPMCPSGQRHEPKFSHLRSMLHAIQSVAPVLLHSPSALGRQFRLETREEDGKWTLGDAQWGFVYQRSSGEDRRRVLFVENAGNKTKTILAPLLTSKRVVDVAAYSSMLFIDDFLAFDSAAVQDEAMSFTRQFEYDPTHLVNWSSWHEPVGPNDYSGLRKFSYPIEQTKLNIESKVFSDYAWYETDFHLPFDGIDASLYIETQEANAFVVYVDGQYAGSNDTHNHLERNVTLSITLGSLARGNHTLSLLSESLGYSNLIGRWGASTSAKKKGITGDVLLGIAETNISLCDGRTWRSLAGLHGEQRSFTSTTAATDDERLSSHRLAHESPSIPVQGRWSSAWFETPVFDPYQKALFLDITQGRGHLWLNGIDLGRYWNISRGDTDEYSQRYYFLPPDYLYIDGKQNQLVFFDAFGGNHEGKTRLLSSWVEHSSTDNFRDEVDFPVACI